MSSRIFGCVTAESGFVPRVILGPDVNCSETMLRLLDLRAHYLNLISRVTEFVFSRKET